MASNSSLADLFCSEGRSSSPSPSCNISNFSFTNSDAGQALSFGLDLSDPVTDSVVNLNQPKASTPPSATGASNGGDAVREVCADGDIRHPDDTTSVIIVESQVNESLIVESKENPRHPTPPKSGEFHHPFLHGSKTQERIQTEASPVSAARKVHTRNELVLQTVVGTGGRASTTPAFLLGSKTRERIQTKASPVSAARKVHTRNELVLQTEMGTGDRTSTTPAVAIAASSSIDRVQPYPGTDSLQKLREWTKSEQTHLENKIAMSTNLTKLKENAMQTTALLSDAIARALEMDSELKQQRKKIEELEATLETLPKKHPGQKR